MMRNPSKELALPRTSSKILYVFLLLLTLSQASLSTSSSLSSSQSISSFVRKLDEVAAGDDASAAATDDYFQYDLSTYSVRFEKCQYVKMYDDDMAENANFDSPLALKHFVIYRLCPSDTCNKTSTSKSSTTCDNEPHGVYTVDVANYLQTIIQYQKESFERMCQNCQNCGDDDAAGDDANCASCPSECAFYQNLGSNGYVDASAYTECTQLEIQNDDDGNNGDDANGGQQAIYIGPRCNPSGKIAIGLFSDENCWTPADNFYNANLENLLGYKLWYYFLKQSYYSNGTCLSCMEDANDENQNDANDADNVNEMCENLYKEAAKCESDTGLSVGFVQTNKEDGQYENQVENEFLACTFINSLIWNSYTETGEINIKAPQDVIVRKVTESQKVSLSILGCTVFALLGVLYFVDRKIKEAEPPQMIAKSDENLT